MPASQRYTYWKDHKVCVVQKEYPTAHRLDKPKRQHWDLSVIKTPPESSAPEGKPSYDYLKLACVVEFGMNESQGHLLDDIQRLSSAIEDGSVDQAFILHLYRLSKPGARFSDRDWSANSKRILSKDDVAEMGRGRPVEILYCMADSTGTYKPGVWQIAGSKAVQLAGGE